MIIELPKSSTLKENDTIALTKNDKFVGYGTVIAVLDKAILVETDKKTSKLFTELLCEDMQFSFDWE